MNAEHLLDAMGLLDDDLVREAERYVRKKPRINYSRWLSWAAVFAIAVTLGYGVTHIRMGGGSNAPAYSGGGAGNTAAGEPAASGGNAAPSGDSVGDVNGIGAPPAVMEPPDPTGEASAPVQGDWLLAFRVDGTVYWDTGEYIQLDPEESDIRYTTSYINSAEPEEDGQANFLPIGRAYVVLDNGTAAVLQEDTGSWRVYDSVPPWKK